MEPLQALARVADRAEAWRRLAWPERAALLRACSRSAARRIRVWAEVSCRLKGADPASRWLGEEALLGPAITLRHLRLYAATLAAGPGTPRAAAAREAAPGQLALPVFPGDRWDGWLHPGVRAEVWLAPAAAPARRSGGPGGVAAVLGAGNVSSIPPLDALHQLLYEDRVAVVKLNPLMAPLAPVFAAALAPLVERGFLAFVAGGAEEGAALLGDERVDAVHLTGSHRTFDAIVWGAGEEGERRRAAGEPLLRKPVTAELGCVSPLLVVPERWDRADLRQQAFAVAGMVVNNGSFNCNAPKLILTSRHWPQRQAFLRELRAALAAAPPRPAWYPGAAERWARFAERYPQAESWGEAGAGELPWLLVPEVPAEPGQPALSEEAFCGVVAECPLDAAGSEEFLDQAVRFANDHVWGSLSCTILAAPTTPRPALERALAGLRYGGVAVNAWAALLFALGQTTWGAFPGEPPEDIRSGRGHVHNTGLLAQPQKSVLRAPFRPPLRPLWDPRHRFLRAAGLRLARFEARPSPARLLSLAAAAVLG
ncbi:MAG: aldehyde dehydrogenase family protein [Planctomycetota bacterium]|nr:MAG: aldehyde dehydrogenase family protein [Planctomycetota bacterium]